MDFRILGPFEVWEAQRLVEIPAPKQRAILAVLVLNAGRVVSTDRLLDLVWGDEQPDGGVKTLWHHISKLRNRLEPGHGKGEGGVLVTRAPGYMLELDGGRVDAAEFEKLADEAHVLLESDPGRARELIDEALRLWRGPALAEFLYEEFARPEIVRLEELRQRAVEDRVEAGLALGHHRQLIGELTSLTEEYPLRERYWGQLMVALYRSGRQADALRAFRDAQETLGSQLGIEPSTELADLEEQILLHDPLLVDVGRPQRSGVGTLPVRFSAFFGRSEEVEDILSRMAEHRLVTVAGPGGIGKSSIAAEVARDSSAHRGAPVVRMAVEDLSEGEVGAVLARCMDLDPAPGVDPVDVIVGFTAKRPHLVLLDGCESRIDEVADLASRLLTGTDQIRLLCTSREPLGLPGESIVRLGPLEPRDAADLFIDRAEISAKAEPLVAGSVTHICEELDGIPLAIELAAARARTAPLDRIEARLDDQVQLLKGQRGMSRRHGSIEATVKWSYDLLEPDRQQTFRRLSVFRRTFDHRDAAAVIDTGTAEDVIDTLVNVSLTQRADDGGSYRMLEPIRQYAHVLLDQNHETDATFEIHAKWIATQSQRIAADVWTPQVLTAQAWVVDHQFEVLGAMQWALRNDRPELAVEIVAALGRIVCDLGLAHFFVDSSVKAVQSPKVSPTNELATAMVYAGFMLSITGNLVPALEMIDRAATIADSIGDACTRARVLELQTRIQFTNTGTTMDHLESMLRLLAFAEEGGSCPPELRVQIMATTAGVAYHLGRLDEAQHWQQRVNELRATMTLQPATTGLTASIMGGQGDLAGSCEAFMRAARMNEEAGSLRNAQGLWEIGAYVAACNEDREHARRCFAHAERIAEKTGLDCDPIVGLRLAALEGDFASCLDQSSDWFKRHGTGADRSDLVGSRPDMAFKLQGSAVWIPEFIDILLVTALSLNSVGRAEESVWIARAAPHLMAQTHHKYYDQTQHTAQFAQLTEGPSDNTPQEVTLTEAFWRVSDMLR